MGMTSSCSCRPSPLHTSQVAVTVLPSPLQVGQVLLLTIWPSMVFTTRFTWPWPWQVAQVLRSVPFLAPVPLHGAQAT